MKVAFLCANYPPEVRAGTELVATALACELRAAGDEVVVICTSNHVHDGTDARVEAYEGVTVVRLFKKLDEWDGGGLQRPRLLHLSGELLREHRPDVVHAHALAAFGAGQLQQANALGIPSVLTFHDLWVTCPRYFRLPPDGITCPSGTDRAPCVACVNVTLRHPEPAVVRRAIDGRDLEVRAEIAAASVLTAPSHTAARMVREHTPCSAPIEVVPHGILRRAVQRAAPPQPGERLRVGTFGNLVPEKGVLELVEACRGLDCELHLAGRFYDAAFEQAVRATAARCGVALVCHGPFGDDTTHPAARLHLAVFPSKCQETYGLVVDEALAHGVPTVVSDLGALRERAGTGGVAVTALPSLTATLHDLLADANALARLRATIPATLPGIADAAHRYRELYARVLARPAVR